jgi:thiamine-phosphate pyrophosphorylase
MRGVSLIVITDAALARPRAVLDVVRAAVGAGAPAVQLRDKSAGARALADAARALLQVTRPAGALLTVNDRLDVALAVGADGVHLGPDDIPVAAARAVVREAEARGDLAPGFVVGTSTDDPAEARRLVTEGADYIGCGTVYPTRSKPDAGEVIGLAGLRRVVAAVDVPVFGIGGVSVAGSAEIARETGAAGIAVIGAVMSAADPGSAVRALMQPWVLHD